MIWGSNSPRSGCRNSARDSSADRKRGEKTRKEYTEPEDYKEMIFRDVMQLAVKLQHKVMRRVHSFND